MRNYYNLEHMYYHKTTSSTMYNIWKIIIITDPKHLYKQIIRIVNHMNNDIKVISNNKIYLIITINIMQSEC